MNNCVRHFELAEESFPNITQMRALSLP